MIPTLICVLLLPLSTGPSLSVSVRVELGARPSVETHCQSRLCGGPAVGHGSGIVTVGSQAHGYVPLVVRRSTLSR